MTMLRPISAAAAAAALVVLAGCAQRPAPIPNYVPPASGAGTARLLMRGALEPGDRYGVFLMENANECKDSRMVGVGVPGRDPAAVAISAAGVRTVDIFMTKANNTFCRVRWSFYPRAGRQYLVTAKSTPGGCNAIVLDATDVDAMKPEATLLRRDAPGMACVPLANSKTIAQLAAQAGSGVAEQRANTPEKRAAQLPTGVSDDDLKALTGP